MKNEEQPVCKMMSPKEFAEFFISAGAKIVDDDGTPVSADELAADIDAENRVSPGNISSLAPGEIFVFGSNLAGQHIGGAAHIAFIKFGAIWGQGEGLQGQSYAIPTMHGGISEIEPYVTRFIAYAKEHKEYRFLVTRIGCGIAGFKDEEMAPLFNKALLLDNVYLPKSFLDVLLADRLPQFNDSVADVSWNSKKWLTDFASAKLHGYTRPVRAQVFENTVELVKQGHYICEDGTQVQLALNLAALKDNVFCENRICLRNPVYGYNTNIEVRNMDCLALARELLEQDGTDDLCVLNMASASRPGGGVKGGAGAQEEYLFRCSDYYRFLFQYARDFDPHLYGIENNARHSYPLEGDSAGIFSHGVTIFRDSESSGYALLCSPWKCNFVAVAANHLRNKTDKIPDFLIGSSLERIRTILRIAYNNGQKRLVLGAFGCGAFNNPPRHMAELFRLVINEQEFKGLFRSISFAVIEDHNSHNGNYKAFHEVICS